MKQSLNNSRFPIFTERFRELQGNRSNTEFADFLGLSRQTVGFYCNGERVPDAIILCDIADRCGVSADWLLGRTDVKTVNPDTISVCSYTGLSEKAVNVLQRLNTVPPLTGIAKPALDRFLCSEHIYEFLGSLCMAYQYGDSTMAAPVREMAFNLSLSPSLSADEKNHYAALYADMKAEADGRDLWSYKTQGILKKSIEEAKG